MNNRTIFVAALTAILASSCAAFDFDLSYAGGHISTVTDDWGDVVTLSDPADLASNSAGADVVANRMISGFHYTVSRGAGISGTVNVDKYDAVWGNFGAYRGYGDLMNLRLNSTDDLSTTRWVLDEQKIYNGRAVSDDLVLGETPLSGQTEPPFYYPYGVDTDNRNGSNSYGPFTLHLDHGVYMYFATHDAHTEGMNIYAFLVTVNGNGNFTLREGVQFGYSAQVVPEPATLTFFGLGLALVARRRKSRKS